MIREMPIEEAVKIMKHLKSIVSSEDYKEAFRMAIEALKESERKRGRWIEYENEYGEKLHYCSECKNDAHRHYSEYRNDVVELLFDYCQHCGSDMRGESE